MRPKQAVARACDHRPGSLHEGDTVPVFSRHADQWVEGEVVKLVDGNFLRVEYEVDEEWCGKTLHLHSDCLRLHIDNNSQAAQFVKQMNRDLPRLKASLDVGAKVRVAEFAHLFDVSELLDGRSSLPAAESLSKFFLDLPGSLSHPVGYGYRFDDWIQHVPSKVNVSAHPLRRDDFAENLMVLYHYTSPESFDRISKSRQLWSTTLNQCKNPNDTCFGDGVYATIKAPDVFGSKKEILTNNYGGVWPGLEDRADFCIAIVIPRCLVVDVMTQGVPELRMKWNITHDRAPTRKWVNGTSHITDPEAELGEIEHRPGFDRHGRPLHNRDIWVIRVLDESGNIAALAEPMHLLLQDLAHPDACNRVRALRRLCEPTVSAAIKGNEAVLETLHQCLKDDDVLVWTHAMDAVDKMALQGEWREAVLDILAHHLEDADLKGDSYVKAVAIDYVAKIAPQGQLRAIKLAAHLVEIAMQDNDYVVEKRAREALGKLKSHPKALR